MAQRGDLRRGVAMTAFTRLGQLGSIRKRGAPMPNGDISRHSFEGAANYYRPTLWHAPPVARGRDALGRAIDAGRMCFQAAFVSMLKQIDTRRCRAWLGSIKKCGVALHIALPLLRWVVLIGATAL